MATGDGKGVNGRVEGTVGGLVTGWAWNPHAPEERLTIAVWVNGRPVASGVADQRLRRLKKAGIGDGRHAFEIRLPDEVASIDRPRVAVRVEGAPGKLPVLETWAETGAEEPWASVQLVEETRGLPAAPIEDDAPAPEDDPATAALTGRDGWLFGLTETETVRLRALQRVVDELQEGATLLEQLGIRYVVAITPPKLAVHPELATVATAGVAGCARELEALSRDSDSLETLDLLPVLLDARRHGPLYLPREETLSAVGAFHVARALVKRAGPPLKALALGAMALAPALESGAGGLDELPMVGAPEQAPGELPDAIDAAALQALRMPAGGHLELDGHPPPRVYEQADAGPLPRAALIGDSVIHQVAPWLAETSARLVVLSTPRVPLVPIELEHPAVVFHLLDDRLLAA